MADIRQLTKDLTDYARNQGNCGLNDANVIGTCPLCGHKVREYSDSYYCENKECGFRRVWKVKKGFPTLKKDTMKQLLETGRAETDKGIYTIIRSEPYISFERAKEQAPDYDALVKLISNYGLKPVNKVPNGGALWFEGEKDNETMKDFISDCAEIGCRLQYAKEAKALKHKSGWHLDVKPEYLKTFYSAFGHSDTGESKNTPLATKEDTVIDLVKESGLEYIDKRYNKGSLWIIAGKEEAADFVKKCKDKGIVWIFAPNGGRATKHRPGWFCK